MNFAPWTVLCAIKAVVIWAPGSCANLHTGELAVPPDRTVPSARPCSSAGIQANAPGNLHVALLLSQEQCLLVTLALA